MVGTVLTAENPLVEVDFDSYEEDAHENVPPVPVVEAEAMPPVPEPLDPSSSTSSS